jgi:glutamine synthetase
VNLDQILGSAKTSSYVDDSCYALLREDLVEWRARGRKLDDPELEAADAMLLFRSATKQIARRLGLHATFMCRPGLPSFYASGWHLHQSLVTPDGANAFASPTELLSPTGLSFVAGLQEHADAASVFATPTINGYRRRTPFSLAPDRATWGVDNRAAMLRVRGDPGTPRRTSRTGSASPRPTRTSS